MLYNKTNFTVRIVSRNLVTLSNFVKFRDNRNFTFFEAPRVTSDTCHMLEGSYGAMCQMDSKSNKSLSRTHVGHVSQLERMEIQRFG